jgi:hypothetical protein
MTARSRLGLLGRRSLVQDTCLTWLPIEAFTPLLANSLLGRNRPYCADSHSASVP